MIASAVLVSTVIALVIFGALMYLVSRLREERGTFALMSDDEFMTNLPPGTSRDVALRVRAIVARNAGVPRENVRPDTKFFEL